MMADLREIEYKWEVCSVTFDGRCCLIQEPRCAPDLKWHSESLMLPAIVIGFTLLFTSRLWLEHSFPTSMHDLSNLEVALWQFYYLVREQ